jgi:hypothetical protein
MDARMWVQEFLKHPTQDEGTLLAWFAGAIMAGYDTAMMHQKGR